VFLHCVSQILDFIGQVDPDGGILVAVVLDFVDQEELVDVTLALPLVLGYDCRMENPAFLPLRLSNEDVGLTGPASLNGLEVAPFVAP
jgi:hypothetical protein